MTDPLDGRLAAAGRVLSHDAEVASALSALSAARASEANTTRRRRIVFPSVVIGSILAVSGAGAVVATTQWRPWETKNPDIVVAHEWRDVSGKYLGSCESRMATEDLTSAARAGLRDFVGSLDLDNISPDPDAVASGLARAGRLKDVGRLIPGATEADFDVSQIVRRPSEWDSDARILQDGLMAEVSTRVSKHLFAQWPELEEVTASGETQCTTDPPRAADK